jgi:hypothetical protein
MTRNPLSFVNLGNPRRFASLRYSKRDTGAGLIQLFHTTVLNKRFKQVF